MTPQLHVVSDFADADEGEPTKPGYFATPGYLTDNDRVVHRIVCPHHSIPWLKVVLVNVLIAAAVCLVARGMR